MLIPMLLCLLVPAEELPVLKLEEVEQKALAARGNLRRGYVEYSIEEEGKKEYPSIQKSQTWFDYDTRQMRTDRWIIPEKGAAPYRTIDCGNCEKKGLRFRHEFVQSENSVRLADLTPDQKRLGSPDSDPRRIGFTLGLPYLHHEDSFDSIHQYPGRKNLELQQQKVQGLPCYVVSFEMPNRRLEYAYAPSLGFAPVRLVSRSTKSDEIRTIINHYPEKAAIYFPTKSVMTINHNNKTQVIRTIIHKAEFNGPPNPGVFSLSGMNLPEDLMVDVPQNGVMSLHRWDGTQLVPYKQTLPAPPAMPRHPSAPPLSPVTFTIAIGLLILSMLLVLVWWRMRKQPLSHP